jgi:hypothetical protein
MPCARREVRLRQRCGQGAANKECQLCQECQLWRVGEVEIVSCATQEASCSLCVTGNGTRASNQRDMSSYARRRRTSHRIHHGSRCHPPSRVILSEVEGSRSRPPPSDVTPPTGVMSSAVERSRHHRPRRFEVSSTLACHLEPTVEGSRTPAASVPRHCVHRVQASVLGGGPVRDLSTALEMTPVGSGGRRTGWVRGEGVSTRFFACGLRMTIERCAVT